MEKIYWDSDCFLGHFQDEKGKVEKCDGVLQRADRGDVIIVTSALTIAEVLWMRGAPRITKDKAEIVQKFFVSLLENRNHQHKVDLIFQSQKKRQLEARKRKMTEKKPRDRPVVKEMPPPILDTLKNVARAIMQGPPKKRWGCLEKSAR